MVECDECGDDDIRPYYFDGNRRLCSVCYRKKVGKEKGLLEEIGLFDWFKQLSNNDKDKLRECYLYFTLYNEEESYKRYFKDDYLRHYTKHKENALHWLEGIPNKDGFYDFSTVESKEDFLFSITIAALRKNFEDLFNIALNKALEVMKNNPIYRHMLYESIAHYYLPKYNKDPGSIDKCIMYLEEDIKHIDELVKAILKSEYYLEIKEIIEAGKKDGTWPLDYIHRPKVDSLLNLIKLYEKKGEIEKALKMCDIGIKYDLDGSGSKYGYRGRKNILRRRYKV